MRTASVLLLVPLLLAGSALAQPRAEPLESALKRAQAEQAAAEAEAGRLERAAAGARGEAARLRAEQAAAAQAIEAAEARITASDAELRLISADLAARRQRLAREQQPVAALLAGLGVMAQRPPLLVMATREAGTDEFVKVRVLLDSTLPVIRRRTAALSAELREGERLEQAAANARRELVQGQRDLVARSARFAALEQEALRSAMATGARALGQGDIALAVGEDVERLRSGAAGKRAAAALAADLAAVEPAPARPFPGEATPPPAPVAYRLPASAPVTEGLGAVNESGVRSRGLTLATRRGEAVAAPATGTVRFSGPFRDYDGLLIIDHGRGWISLLLNVASPLKPGAKVRPGEPVGRALGPLGVELSQNGRRVSPAIIAGSSQTLLNKPKGG